MSISIETMKAVRRIINANVHTVRLNSREFMNVNYDYLDSHKINDVVLKKVWRPLSDTYEMAYFYFKQGKEASRMLPGLIWTKQSNESFEEYLDYDLWADSNDDEVFEAFKEDFNLHLGYESEEKIEAVFKHYFNKKEDTRFDFMHGELIGETK